MPRYPFLYQLHNESTAKIPRSPKSSFNSDTGLFGVTNTELQVVIHLIETHFRDLVIDVYAIGSRVSGKSTIGSIVRETSDLDILLHLREGRSKEYFAKIDKLEEELEAKRLSFSIQFHTTTTPNDRRTTDSICSFQGGEVVTSYTFIDMKLAPKHRGMGSAIRLPKNQ